MFSVLPYYVVVLASSLLLLAAGGVSGASVLGGYVDPYSFPTVAALFNLNSQQATNVELAPAVISDSTSVASLLSSNSDFALSSTPLTASQGWAPSQPDCAAGHVNCCRGSISFGSAHTVGRCVARPVESHTRTHLRWQHHSLEWTRAC